MSALSGLHDLSDLGLGRMTLRERAREKREEKARLAEQIAYWSSPQYLIDLKQRCHDEGRLWHSFHGCV